MWEFDKETRYVFCSQLERGEFMVLDFKALDKGIINPAELCCQLGIRLD